MLLSWNLFIFVFIFLLFWLRRSGKLKESKWVLITKIAIEERQERENWFRIWLLVNFVPSLLTFCSFLHGLKFSIKQINHTFFCQTTQNITFFIKTHIKQFTKLIAYPQLLPKFSIFCKEYSDYSSLMACWGYSVSIRTQSD